jgi:protein-tyrosine phosphatase
MRACLKALWWFVPVLVLPGCAHPAEEATAAPSGGSTAATAAPAEAEARVEAEAEVVATGSAPADPAESAPRAVLVGHVENARDLGGVALGSGRRVGARVLFRGPPLASLSEDGCGAVSELGIRSVIDLRVASEVSLKPDDACALTDAQLLAAPLPVPFNVSAADYIAILDASESIVRVFEQLGDAANYPMYFHCTWGRDRTGVIVAVVLLALGATPEAIMADYLVSGETVGAYPASLQAALDEIANRGGIAAYLAAVGVTDQQLATLRAHAVDTAH